MKLLFLALTTLATISCATSYKSTDRQPNQSGGGTGDIGSVVFSATFKTTCQININGSNGPELPLILKQSGSVSSKNYNVSFDSDVLNGTYKARVIISQNPMDDLMFSAVLVLTDNTTGIYSINQDFIDHSSPVLRGSGISTILGYQKKSPTVQMNSSPLKVNTAQLSCDLTK